jgi:hypothetical protein
MDFTNLFSHAEIRVHLAPNALMACEVQRSWLKPTVTRKASFEFVSGERASALDALQAWIGEAPARRSIIWIVGPTEAQYFMLPWSPASVDRSMRDAYARAQFEQLYGREASGAAFCFAEPSEDCGQLVSCISIELHAELAAHAERSRCELGGIKPSISAVWDRFRDVLDTEQGTLCVVEGDRQAIVRHNKRRIEEIVVKRCGGKDAGVLAGRHGVFRRFSNASGHAPAAETAAELKLPKRRGFAGAQDAAYSFALCGAL